MCAHTCTHGRTSPIPTYTYTGAHTHAPTRTDTFMLLTGVGILRTDKSGSGCMNTKGYSLDRINGRLKESSLFVRGSSVGTWGTTFVVVTEEEVEEYAGVPGCLSSRVMLDN